MTSQSKVQKVYQIIILVEKFYINHELNRVREKFKSVYEEIRIGTGLYFLITGKQRSIYSSGFGSVEIQNMQLVFLSNSILYYWKIIIFSGKQVFLYCIFDLKNKKTKCVLFWKKKMWKNEIKDNHVYSKNYEDAKKG